MTYPAQARREQRVGTQERQDVHLSAPRENAARKGPEAKFGKHLTEIAVLVVAGLILAVITPASLRFFGAADSLPEKSPPPSMVERQTAALLDEMKRQQDESQERAGRLEGELARARSNREAENAKPHDPERGAARAAAEMEALRARLHLLESTTKAQEISLLNRLADAEARNKLEKTKPGAANVNQPEPEPAPRTQQAQNLELPPVFHAYRNRFHSNLTWLIESVEKGNGYHAKAAVGQLEYQLRSSHDIDTHQREEARTFLSCLVQRLPK